MKIEIKHMEFKGKFTPASSESKQPDVYNFDVTFVVNDTMMILSLSLKSQEIEDKLKAELKSKLSL